MPTTLIQEMAAGNAPPFVPLTVDQYHDLSRAGVIPEGAPIELLDGLLVYKDRRDDPGSPLMTHGPKHATVVAILQQLLASLVASVDGHVRSQLPITLPPGNEPEPDISVVKGDVRAYFETLPLADDVLAVVEVADSSRVVDRGTKSRIYSEAGIPTYAIVDLVEKVIEIYTSPIPTDGRYDDRETFGRGERAALVLAGQPISFAVDDVLP